MLTNPTDWRKFARDLVTTGEIDPMYRLIWKGGRRYGSQWADQYALHFFMYYDAGQAAALANATTELDFWHMQNYGYGGFLRGSERRHFRGEKGRQAMLTFQHMGSPGSVWYLMGYAPFTKPGGSIPYTTLVDRIASRFPGTQTGPYFSWKAMDLLDRCLEYPITLSLDEALKYLPDEPRRCAKRVWPDCTLKWVLQTVKGWIEDLAAPGSPDRSCSYSEAETILCAINGAIKGTYKFGSDIDSRRAQVGKDHPYLLDLLPPTQDWRPYVQTLDP